MKFIDFKANDMWTLPCSRRMLSFRFTFRSPFFRMPMTISYDRPGCACSAFVSAARSVCDATTSRRSNCKSFNQIDPMSSSIDKLAHSSKSKLHQSIDAAKRIEMVPVIRLVAKVRARLALKLVYHRSLSWCYSTICIRRPTIATTGEMGSVSFSIRWTLSMQTQYW